MSKLIDNIRFNRHETVKIHYSPNVIIETEHSLIHDGFIEMRVGVTLGSIVRVVKNDFEEQMAVNKVKALIMNEIFGEFRKPLYASAVALSNRDFNTSSLILKEVFDNMFNIN